MQARESQTAAGAVVLLGAVAGVLGPLLGWFDVFVPSTSESETLKGTDLDFGTGIIGIAVVLGIMGIVLLARGARTGGKGASITAIVLGALIAFSGLYAMASPGDALASFGAGDMSEVMNVSESEARDAIQAAVDSGVLEVSGMAGALIAGLGGVCGVIGGIMGVRRSKRIREASSAQVQVQPQTQPPVGPS